MKRSKRTVTTTEHRLEFTADDLRRALDLPSKASLHVRVPGGGDWSSMNLGVDEATPLVATWDDTSEVEE